MLNFGLAFEAAMVSQIYSSGVYQITAVTHAVKTWRRAGTMPCTIDALPDLRCSQSFGMLDEVLIHMFSVL
jgi:hypothetical protein